MGVALSHPIEFQGRLLHTAGVEAVTLEAVVRALLDPTSAAYAQRFYRAQGISAAVELTEAQAMALLVALQVGEDTPATEVTPPAPETFCDFCVGLHEDAGMVPVLNRGGGIMLQLGRTCVADVHRAIKGAAKVRGGEELHAAE